MKDTRLIMGMPITVEILGPGATSELLEDIFSYFSSIDERFSTYKDTSETMRLNRGEVAFADASEEMKTVLDLAERTKQETAGYFDAKKPDGSLDPSGIVKGWAIRNAANFLQSCDVRDFYIDAGGDIQASGKNATGKEWSVGIRNPFNREEVIKVVHPHGRGVATSGTYIRGQHIYNPHEPGAALEEIVSLTVLGPDICEADRFATAAFAMGKKGIAFIETLPGFEGYAVGADGIATMTSGFEKFIVKVAQQA